MIMINSITTPIPGAPPAWLRRGAAIQLLKDLGGSERLFKSEIRSGKIVRDTKGGGAAYYYNRDSIVRVMEPATNDQDTMEPAEL